MAHRPEERADGGGPGVQRPYDPPSFAEVYTATETTPTIAVWLLFSFAALIGAGAASYRGVPVLAVFLLVVAVGAVGLAGSDYYRLGRRMGASRVRAVGYTIGAAFATALGALSG